MNIFSPHDKIRYYTDLLSEDEKIEITQTLASMDSWERIFDDGHEERNIPEDDNGNQSIMVMYRREMQHPKDERFAQILENAYKKAHAAYVEEFQIQGNNPISRIGAIDKHLTGTAYATHVDSAPVGVESYTMLMYLNDDYTGGELSFTMPKEGRKLLVRNGIIADGPRSNRRPDDPMNVDLIDFTIKPEAFSIVIFPPLYPYAHTVHKILSGEKYIIKGHWQVNKSDLKQWSSSPYEGFTPEEIATKENMANRHNDMYAAMQENPNLVPQNYKEFYL